MLSRAISGSPRGEYVTMPILGRVWLELAEGSTVDDIEGAVFARLAELGLQPIPINHRTMDSLRDRLTLAWAVRSPDDHSVRAGTQDQWMRLDIDAVQACGIAYASARERLNPLAFPMTEEQFEEVRLAHEKKNLRMLRSFDVVLLSNYLATTDAPPRKSPRPPPSPGQS